MTEHTSGPWVHMDDRRRAYTGEGSYLVMDAELKTVARVPIPIHECPRPHDQAEANARLIAAAPDLLAALDGAYTALARVRDCLDIHSDALERHGLADDLDAYFRDAGVNLMDTETDALAALRKARGE